MPLAENTYEGDARLVSLRRNWIVAQIMRIPDGLAEPAQPMDGRSWAAYGLILPSSFDGSAITFKVSDTRGGTYVPLYDSTGTLVSITVSASRAIELPVSLFMWHWWKVVAGTAQTGDTDIIVVAKG